MKTHKTLPEETLTALDAMVAADAHVYLPSPILRELLRGYRRYVALAAPSTPEVPRG